MEKIRNCSCGSEANMRASIGGPTIYYGIYCSNKECGNDNRKYNSSIYAYGLTGAGGFPPMDSDVAVKEWNEKHYQCQQKCKV